MDEDEGSGRWNGQIEAWVPRANRGEQVFSPELRPRSATFHQPQDELGYHKHSTEAEWREDVFFFFKKPSVKDSSTNLCRDFIVVSRKYNSHFTLSRYKCCNYKYDTVCVNNGSRTQVIKIQISEILGDILGMEILFN